MFPKDSHKAACSWNKARYPCSRALRSPAGHSVCVIISPHKYKKFCRLSSKIRGAPDCVWRWTSDTCQALSPWEFCRLHSNSLCLPHESASPSSFCASTAPETRQESAERAWGCPCWATHHALREPQCAEPWSAIVERNCWPQIYART